MTEFGWGGRTGWLLGCEGLFEWRVGRCPVRREWRKSKLLKTRLCGRLSLFVEWVGAHTSCDRPHVRLRNGRLRDHLLGRERKDGRTSERETLRRHSILTGYLVLRKDKGSSSRVSEALSDRAAGVSATFAHRVGSCLLGGRHVGAGLLRSGALVFPSITTFSDPTTRSCRKPDFSETRLYTSICRLQMKMTITETTSAARATLRRASSRAEITAAMKLAGEPKSHTPARNR